MGEEESIWIERGEPADVDQKSKDLVDVKKHYQETWSFPTKKMAISSPALWGLSASNLAAIRFF